MQFTRHLVVSMPKLSSHWRSDRNGCHKVVSVLTGLGCSVLSPPCQREIDWSQAQTEWGDTQKIWRKHWETFESSEDYLQTAMKSWWQAFVLEVYLSREVLNNYWCWTLEPNKIVGIFFLTSWRGDAACWPQKSVPDSHGWHRSIPGIFITVTSEHRLRHCLGYFVFCCTLCPRPLPALIILLLHQPAPAIVICHHPDDAN